MIDFLVLVIIGILGCVSGICLDFIFSGHTTIGEACRLRVGARCYLGIYFGFLVDSSVVAPYSEYRVLIFSIIVLLSSTDNLSKFFDLLIRNVSVILKGWYRIRKFISKNE